MTQKENEVAAAPTDLAKENEQRCVWIDLEMTGLDRDEGCILEIAVVVTDREFNELGRFQTNVFPTKTLYDGRGLLLLEGLTPEKCEVGATVRKMHTDNGLFDEIRAGRGESPSVAEGQALAMIDGEDAVGAPLCGSSVGFDRDWLKVHMPKLAAALHYRTFDVSGLRIAAQSLGCEFPKRGDDGRHRALEDILVSIALAEEALQKIGEAVMSKS